MPFSGKSECCLPKPLAPQIHVNSAARYAIARDQKEGAGTEPYEASCGYRL